MLTAFSRLDSEERITSYLISLRILRRNWIILPFLIFSGLSIFWSVYWQISLYRWLILLFTIIAGGYIGLRYNLKEIIKLLSVFGVYILFLSSLLVFFMPDIGVMNYYIIQGAWKGLYWHKNHMGLIASFVNILFLINIVYSFQSKEKRTLLVLGFIVFIFITFCLSNRFCCAYITTIFLHGVILLALILLQFGKGIPQLPLYNFYHGLNICIFYFIH